MTYQVITYNQVVGAHKWEKAPKRYAYLKDLHRHVFIIRCKFDVSHGDREIEINDMQDSIEKALERDFKKEEGLGIIFDGMSCEDIARYCIENFGCIECEVLEDGYGGANARK